MHRSVGRGVELEPELIVTDHELLQREAELVELVVALLQAGLGLPGLLVPRLPAYLSASYGLLRQTLVPARQR